MPRRFFTLVRFAVLLAAVVALGVVAEGEAAKPRREPPTLSATADKSTYVLGELPKFSLVLTNPNEVPIRVLADPKWAVFDLRVDRSDTGRRWKALARFSSYTTGFGEQPSFPPRINATLASGGFVEIPVLVGVDDGWGDRFLGTPESNTSAPRGLGVGFTNPRAPGEGIFYVLRGPGYYRLRFTYRNLHPMEGEPPDFAKTLRTELIFSLQ